MRLYCLTCDTYRKEQIILPQLKQLEGDNLQVIFFPGITGYEISNYIHLLYKSDGKRVLRPSEIAISLSFYKITLDFYYSNEPLCIICEDDIIFLSSNIPNDLDTYFLNSGLKRKRITGKRPHIFYGCYIEKERAQNITKNAEERIFHRTCSRYGNPLYIINRSFARIILRDFFPIETAYDDYLRKLVERYKVNAYRASPMLAYELSSDYYTAFYRPEDIIHKEFLKRTSMQEIPSSRIVTFCSDMSPKIYSKYITEKTGFAETYQNQKIDGLYLVLSESLELSFSNTSIISGAGIDNSEIFDRLNAKNNLIKPYLVLSVRGPLTRKKLLNSGIFCPRHYGDPLLTISNFYTPKVHENSDAIISKKKGIICKKAEERLIKMKILEIGGDLQGYSFIDIANSSDESLEKVIDSINMCESILSTYLQGIILAHSYGLHATWISVKELTDVETFRFIDYYAGLAASLKNINYDNPEDLDPQNIKNLYLTMDDLPSQKIVPINLIQDSRPLRKNMLTLVPEIQDTIPVTTTKDMAPRPSSPRCVYATSITTEAHKVTRAKLAKAGKTAKAAKVAKVAKAAKTAKVAKAAKTAKVTKAPKTAKAAKTAKGEKAAELAKVAKTVNKPIIRVKVPKSVKFVEQLEQPGQLKQRKESSEAISCLTLTQEEINLLKAIITQNNPVLSRE